MLDKEKVRKATLKYFNGDELATNVWMTKYALKNNSGEYVEKTPDDMHKRLAAEFTRIEEKFNSERALSFETTYEYLKNFKYIVPQGSPMMGIGNNYVNVSLSNCVVVESPDDNISSIVDSGKHLANLFKRRCGVGLDLSALRPEGAIVNNSAGTTTGAWSFADFYSYICRMIGQNGRRGALMISMDIRHPDIEEFATMKHDLSKITGANISIKISDSFMKAVENKEMFMLQFPVESENPTHTKEIEAEALWDTIIDSATRTAEPGLLMWDNIVNNLPAESYPHAGFKTITTNPCGEIPLSAYDSCRLVSINLKNLVDDAFTKKAKFDYNKLSEVAAMAMRLSDDLVELEIEKLNKIVEACDTPDEKELWTNLKTQAVLGRRTGLGTHGLADALACLSLAYDSEEALKEVEKIYETIRDAAYMESARLSEERGAFEVFEWEKEKDNEYIKRLPQNIQALMEQVGRRNISILTNAPTGSVSILSQTSSGLEPVFRNKYVRRRKLSHNEQDVKADYIDALGDRWTEYEVLHHNVEQWMSMFEGEEIPEFFTESDQIDWLRRIEVQSAIQKNIDHSISSTINLPKDTPPALVGELYFNAWKKGLKGVTVYVDGSRSGVLIDDSERRDTPAFPHNRAPRRPVELVCNIHHTTIKGEKWTILIGLLDDQPYEVMGGLSNYIEIPKKYTQGILIKKSRKTVNSIYDLKFGENGDEIVIKDIVKVFDNPNHSAFTRMISLGLRHGAPAQYVVEQMQKDRDSDMFSFAKCVARVLKNYIEDGTEASDKTCPVCDTEGLVYVDGCVSCKTCGHAKCG